MCFLIRLTLRFAPIITFVIPNELKEIIKYVIDYAGDSSNDWFQVKKELVNLFPPKERTRFSRRHYSTKKHLINDFDREVIKYWENQTGNRLLIDETKLHPESWEQQPRGWGLAVYNERRKQKKT